MYKYNKLVEQLRFSPCRSKELQLMQDAADAIEDLMTGHIFTGFGIALDEENPINKLTVGTELVATAGPGWRINDVLLDGWRSGAHHDRVLVVYVREKEESDDQPDRSEADGED